MLSTCSKQVIVMNGMVKNIMSQGLIADSMIHIKIKWIELSIIKLKNRNYYFRI